MAQTYKVSKLKELKLDSADNFSGSQISTTDLNADETDLEVTVLEGDTDTDERPYYSAARLEGTIGIEDYDFLFVDTLASGNTVETEMANNSVIYAKIILEGGTLTGGSIAIRARVMPRFGAGDAEGNIVGVMDVNHVKHDGVHTV